MIHKLYTYQTDAKDPYHNLALEEHLLKVLPSNAIVLYLWQNAHTVVIGKNQNAFKEVHIMALEKDGGTLARRLSGGGAVYHDLGNLNFTFVMPEAAFDVSKQMSVIVRAVQSFSIDAQIVGRNDASVDGRKFSGNAYYHNGQNAYHHGTILVDTNAALMEKYLNVSEKKLASKGVESVKSRVINLKELNPAITINLMKQALITAFEQVYDAQSTPLDSALLSPGDIGIITERISDDAYTKGKRFEFTFERVKRFDWGEIQIQLKVEKGVISEAAVYSDAMDTKLAQGIRFALIGCDVSHVAFEEALANLDENLARDILLVLEGEDGGL